jgi:dipeptidyl aminopeptidase/acylaminoacyl peptidase
LASRSQRRGEQIRWTGERERAKATHIGAALVGVTFTPETFACGVSINGVSNLGSLLDTIPPNRDFGAVQWNRFVGDPNRAEDRKEMDARSPVFHADKVMRPVLLIHGAKDDVVAPEQSQQMADALKRSGKRVEYLVLPSEGHSFRSRASYIKVYERLETFLGDCLGGKRGAD